MGKAAVGTALAFCVLIVFAFGGPVEMQSQALPQEGLLANSTELLSQLGEDFFSHGVLWKLSLDDPTTDETSPPDIVCTEEGVFPVEGSCSDYYHCHDLSPQGIEDWYLLWFTCPNGTVFDVDTKACSHLDSSRERARCQQTYAVDLFEDLPSLDDVGFTSEDWSNIDQDLIPTTIFTEREKREAFDDRIPIPSRKRRSTGHATKVEIAAMSAKEACDDVKVVNDYVEYVISKQPSTLRGYSEREYTAIVTQYNENLSKAKSNTNSWSGKNGIISTINETFFLTKMFEPKFTERFLRMEKRVSTVLTQDRFEVERLENELSEIRNDIRNTEKTLTETVNKGVNEYIKKSLENILTGKRDVFSRRFKAYERARKDAEFDELVEILEHVRNDAIEVQEKAIDAKLKMQTFHNNIMQDKSHFERSRDESEREAQSLKIKAAKNKRWLIENSEERRNLESEISAERDRIVQINRNVQQAENVLRRDGQVLRREIKSANDKIIAGSVLLVIPVIGWIAGGALLGVGIEDKKSALHQMEASYASHANLLKSVQRHHSWLHDQIYAKNHKIDDLEGKYQDIQEKLPELAKLGGDLQNLKNDLDKTLLVISKAILSLESIKIIFEDTEADLREVIDQAKKAHTKAEQRVASYFMYHVVEDKLKSHWGNAAEKIISVGSCIKQA